MTDRNFGRYYAYDERDNLYAMRPKLSFDSKKVYRYWASGPILDQGATSHCVAYAWKQWLQSVPIKQGQTLLESSIYDAAQLVDEWEGEEYQGTSVRAGAKVMQSYGYISEYRWATSVDDIIHWILEKGPVVAGTSWYEGMMEPNKSGLISPTGSWLGGHAYLLSGYNKKTGLIRGTNSWGKPWGRTGKFYISGEDFKFLLEDQGEVCAAVEKKPS